MLKKTLTRLTVGAATATTAVLVGAPMAMAGPPQTFNNLGACQQAGGNAIATAGGPASGLTYYREKTYGVPAGVAGCPATAKDGCIGEYYILRTRNV